jgi:hypothetical protein
MYERRYIRGGGVAHAVVLGNLTGRVHAQCGRGRGSHVIWLGDGNKRERELASEMARCLDCLKTTGGAKW